jgi:hypothetical protein
VRLSIHDVQGREITILVDSARDAGWHSVRWSGEDARRTRVPPGLYLARLHAPGELRTRKIVVVP